MTLADDGSGLEGLAERLTDYARRLEAGDIFEEPGLAADLVDAGDMIRRVVAFAAHVKRVGWRFDAHTGSLEQLIAIVGELPKEG